MEKRLLEEILVRIKLLQDTLDAYEVKDILRDPRYRKALREAEADVKYGRERTFSSFLEDLRKRT
jgi:hypothetical protein